MLNVTSTPMELSRMEGKAAAPVTPLGLYDGSQEGRKRSKKIDIDDDKASRKTVTEERHEQTGSDASKSSR